MISDAIDIKAIDRRLNPDRRMWDKPERWGDDAWFITGPHQCIIVSLDQASDPGTDWIHASISYQMRSRMPSYNDLKMLHRAVFGDAPAYQCFVPEGEHINQTHNVLHLWGKLDGKPALPNFGWLGTI
jgi:hypothetical protein